MKLRGAGWLIGSLVTLSALGSIAACDDGESGNGIAITIDAGFNGFETGTSTADGSVPGQDGGSTPTDSGSDAGNQQDSSLPAQCNDGKVDLGETCDPLDKCPTDCPPQGCNLRTLENGGTCAAVCTVVATQTQCQNGDGCCPTDCTIANDNDCLATCGNGVKEAGEKCDGKDCPTDCPPIGCQLRTLNNAGTCQAECVDAATKITQCGAVADGGAASDQCCPTGCTSGNDPDCAAGACGNGSVDNGETCDTGIKGSCPTTCPAQACNLFKLDQGGTCQAACVADGSITQCLNGDGCCAPGCNNTNDSDCPAQCGNNVTEPPGETCDGNCPTTCPAQGCQLFTLQNSGTCTAKCVAGGQQTTCANGDGCCPAGCNNATDNDCPVSAPTCGNGKLDPGETCDNSDPANPCPTCSTKVTCVGSTGSAATCDLRCDQPIGKCSGKLADACCPYNGAITKGGADCTSALDADCNASWRAVSLPSQLAFKTDGECQTIVLTNIEAGGAYDVTTCSTTVSAAGDVVIKSVAGTTVVVPPSLPRTINYGSNDNCLDEKWALPYRAGMQCNNKDGKPTMACVAEGPGGFIAKNATDLTVTICAVGGDASVPFTLFYNSVAVPVIKF